MSGPALTPMDALAVELQELIELLDEAGEPYWHRWMQRALERIDGHQLAGVSQVLAAYGGAQTFSDLELAPALRKIQPDRHAELNGRLVALRDRIFMLADTVASGTAGGDAGASRSGP